MMFNNYRRSPMYGHQKLSSSGSLLGHAVVGAGLGAAGGYALGDNDDLVESTLLGAGGGALGVIAARKLISRRTPIVNNSNTANSNRYFDGVNRPGGTPKYTTRNVAKNTTSMGAAADYLESKGINDYGIDTLRGNGLNIMTASNNGGFMSSILDKPWLQSALSWI